MLHINDSKTTSIVNKYGENVTVNWDGEARFMDYDNDLGFIEWNVPCADDPRFHTDVLVAGKVDSISERLSTWNNMPKVVCAIACSGLDDKARESVEESVAEYVAANQELFFTKSGNWRMNNRRQQRTAIFAVCEKAYREVK